MNKETLKQELLSSIEIAKDETNNKDTRDVNNTLSHVLHKAYHSEDPSKVFYNELIQLLFQRERYRTRINELERKYVFTGESNKFETISPKEA